MLWYEGHKKDLQIYERHRGGRISFREVWRSGTETEKEKEADHRADEKDQPEKQREKMPEEDAEMVQPG